MVLPRYLKKYHLMRYQGIQGTIKIIHTNALKRMEAWLENVLEQSQTNYTKISKVSLRRSDTVLRDWEWGEYRRLRMLRMIHRLYRKLWFIHTHLYNYISIQLLLYTTFPTSLFHSTLLTLFVCFLNCIIYYIWILLVYSDAMLF